MPNPQNHSSSHAWLSLLTLTFRDWAQIALFQHLVKASQCFVKLNTRIRTARSNSELAFECTEKPGGIPCSPILAMRESTIHQKAFK